MPTSYLNEWNHYQFDPSGIKILKESTSIDPVKFVEHLVSRIKQTEHVDSDKHEELTQELYDYWERQGWSPDGLQMWYTQFNLEGSPRQWFWYSTKPRPTRQQVSSSNPIVAHNIRQIRSNNDHSLDDGTIRTIVNFIESQPNVLQNHKITRFLGAGQFGAAFEIDNGHVVKIGENYNDDLGFYKRHLDRLHSGKGNRLMVYEFKQVGDSLFLVETNKFLTIREYLEISPTRQVPTADWFSFYGGNISFKFLELRHAKIQFKSPKELYEYLETKETYVIKQERLTLSAAGITNERDQDGIIQAVIRNLFDEPQRRDLHFGNLGVDISSGIDRPVFQYFDA